MGVVVGMGVVGGQVMLAWELLGAGGQMMLPRESVGVKSPNFVGNGPVARCCHGSRWESGVK